LRGLKFIVYLFIADVSVNNIRFILHKLVTARLQKLLTNSQFNNQHSLVDCEPAEAINKFAHAL
jgi:hypothetical protein